ncbi:FG-GAP repeat domain-containing protein [Streptomyces sp. YIM B13518]|uniref:FG-GAP repeat domain-containing protein n=1 Tax=Streptomyces sp. YIM B13518 TaxID=3366316 RepID=UPI0036AD9C2A
MFVPYGDLNGDRCNDVLVRYGSGALRAHRPACGAAVTPSTAYTSLGTSGWTQYDVLISPGDVSGDGRPDLIARQASTKDVHLYTATSTGRLSARTKIASKWTGYKKVVGVGDLLAQDKSNELWRCDGAGTGPSASACLVLPRGSARETRKHPTRTQAPGHRPGAASRHIPGARRGRGSRSDRSAPPYGWWTRGLRPGPAGRFAAMPVESENAASERHTWR